MFYRPRLADPRFLSKKSPGISSAVYNYWAENSLCMRFEGTDESTTFVDSSPHAQTITAVNGAKLDNGQSKWGTVSGFFDGTNDHLTVPQHVRFSLEFCDFDIGIWVRRAASGVEHYLLSKRSDAPATGWEFRINATNKTQFFYTGGTSLIGTVDVPSGQWAYVRARRKDNTLELAVDGVSAGTAACNNGVLNTASTLKIGTDSSVSSFFSGYMGGLRIVRGIAIGALTDVPTAQFPAA